MATTLTSLLSKQDTVSLLELIQASVVCEQEEQLKALINGMQSLLPFDSAVCSLVKTENGELADQCDVVNISYPAEWLELYFDNDFHLIDPILIENFTNFGVQYWSDTYKKHGNPKEFIALAEDFELKGGYSCGLMDHTQREGSLFSLAGEASDHPRNRAILDILVPHLHHALSHVARGTRVQPATSISAREQEVLKWISEGKSSWEIAMILVISERTVKFHTAAILNKLGAANRAHAVAIALSSGMISMG
jgi:DNA-binding CsgD family transcriptional regulator